MDKPIVLNQEQTKAKDRLLSFLHSDSKAIVLSGQAGTGKSTLIKEVYNEFMSQAKLHKIINSNYEIPKFYFTATTHKACNNLDKILNIPNITVSTIHSLLRLYLYNDGTFYQASTIFPLLKHTVVVIDEFSMIDYVLFKYIQAIQGKVIYIGDTNQLPPIGLDHSPILHQGYDVIQLNQIVRQQHSHHLAQVCTKFRQYIEGKSLTFPKITLSNEIHHVSETEFYSLIQEAFKHDWKDNKAKILAYKNQSIATYNNYIHRLLKGREHLAQGDTAIVTKPILGLSQGQEVYITSHNQHCYLGIKGYSYEVSDIGLHNIFVPNNYKDLKRLKKLTVGMTYDRYIAMLQPAYATTIHKSQGSTFDVVFLDVKDLKDVKSKRELARLLYVALSRAKHKVIITGDIS